MQLAGVSGATYSPPDHTVRVAADTRKVAIASAGALATARMPALSAAEVAALSTAQLAALSAYQVATLSAVQLAALSQVQAAALPPGTESLHAQQVAAFTRAEPHPNAAQLAGV